MLHVLYNDKYLASLFFRLIWQNTFDLILNTKRNCYIFTSVKVSVYFKYLNSEIEYFVFKFQSNNFRIAKNKYVWVIYTFKSKLLYNEVFIFKRPQFKDCNIMFYFEKLY